MLNANILFHIFSIFLVISAFMVIASQHAVFSLLFLVSCFVFSTFLLLCLECEFLALIFLTIYVGAIAVLFLFAVMMLETKLINLANNKIKYLPIGIFLGISTLALLVYNISHQFMDFFYSSDIFYFNKYQNWYDLIDSIIDVKVYGQVLYSYFVLQFLVAGLILLLVLVGVVYLTNTFNTQRLEQSIFKQLSRNSKFFFDK